MLFNRIIVLLMLTLSFSVAIAKTVTTSAIPRTDRASTLIRQTSVDLNLADVDTLMTLHGIGKVKAQAIITYRQQQGAFKSVDDLAHVKGLSQNAVAKLEKTNPGRLVVGSHS